MNVVDRLALLVDWEPVAYWRPARFRPFRSVVLNRIAAAGACLSIRHMYKRMQTAVKIAIQHVTPEMEWFRRVPSQPSGQENRLPLKVWGHSGV